MPPVPVPPSQWLTSQFTGLSRQQQGMASQQQETITNSLGQPILNFGLVPGSNPAEYGLQFVNPATGAPIMLLGEDGSGNVAMQWFDGSGNLLWKQDATGSSWYNTSGALIRKDDAAGSHYYDGAGHEISRLDTAGLHVYNTSGTEEVAAGLLNSSPAIYGLGVLPYGGTQLQQVGGSLQVTAPTQSSVVSNGTWTDFPAPSSVTCEIGPSGDVQISVSTYLGTYGGNEPGSVGVAADGTHLGTWAELSVGATGGVAGIVGSTYMVTGLTPGTHTFQLQYETGANPETFSQTTMTVQPL